MPAVQLSRSTRNRWHDLIFCLLFFIDETGHETFADKNYPVFGVGGCAINSSSAAAVIAELWRATKAAHFGGEDVPLHDFATQQLNSLMPCHFPRATVCASCGDDVESAVLPTGKTPL